MIPWPWPQGRVFPPSYFHSHGWSRSASSSEGRNSSTGLSRLACWSWWQSHCLQLTCKVNICSGYMNSEKKIPRKSLQGLFNGAKVVPSIQESLFQVWQWNQPPGPTEDAADLPPVSSWMEELNIIQERGRRKIFPSVTLGDRYVKSLALILTFKWHFC